MEKLNEIKNLVEENSKLEKKMDELGIISINYKEVHFREEDFFKLFNEYIFKIRESTEYPVTAYKNIDDIKVFCMLKFSELKKLDKQKAIELLECF